MNHYIVLLRPSNFVITVASVFVACLLAGGRIDNMPAMIVASFAAGLIGAGGMVINDIFDMEIDRINKPQRPLPSGSVSPKSAALFYAILSAVGLLLNLFLHSNAQAIAAGAVVLIFFYSFKLKGTPLFGNLTVGFLTGLAFIYGGAAVGNSERALIPALFAFLINVGREIIKDMEDVEGDTRNHAVTFPIKYGMRPASTVASLFLLAVICSTIIPFATHQYGILYFILVTLGVNCVIAYVLFSIWKDSSPKNLNRLSTILKYDMLVGLIALYAG
jgi:geranylgeranylglycerol-phosphate geranylgeranyltransferase